MFSMFMIRISRLFITAWGASDIVTVATDASDGFEADEGFDSFLAMQAPPQVIQLI